MAKIKSGEVFEHSFQFSQEDVEAYAKVSGDNNPVHLDPDFAAKTQFKKPIMHGMLSASVFSKVFGTIFPGDGSIYLKQSLNFKRPMFVDTEYKAVFEVQEVNEARHSAVIKSSIFSTESNRAKLLVDGEALILNEERF